MGTLTDWMIRWLARKYDSPADAIEAFAERLGVEVYLDRERAVVEAIAEEPMAVFEGCTPYAIEEADEALQWIGPSGEALLVQPDPIREADRGDQLEYLSDLADRLEMPPETWCVDPIKKIERVEDDPTLAYLWLLSDRATGDDVDSLERALTERYRDQYGRDPEALHLILRDVEEVREIPSHVIEHTIKPWLRDREEQLDDGSEAGGPEV